MLLPLVMTLIIALPLYQVLKTVVAHPAVQYGLDLILILTVDESRGWGAKHRPGMGSGYAIDNLTMGNTG
jgi:hypothetical protein